MTSPNRPPGPAPDKPSPPPSGPYRHRYQIAFSDTDAARIAFTGRFSEWCLAAIESWMRDRLATDWFRLNVDDGIGTPFVHLSMDMASPLTPRDLLVVTVRVARAGRSSLEFHLEGRTDAEDRLAFAGRYVCVFIDTTSGKSIPIPERFRAAIGTELTFGSVPGPSRSLESEVDQGAGGGVLAHGGMVPGAG